jgi:hypothetical protein
MFGLEVLMEEERELLLKEVREWITRMEAVCQSPEIIALIHELEKEHHAWQRGVRAKT